MSCWWEVSRNEKKHPLEPFFFQTRRREKKDRNLTLFLFSALNRTNSLFTSVNYFGFENGMTMVDGLWANTRDALIADFATVVWRMKLLGINAVRLPFSFLEFSKTPQSIVWPSCGVIDPNRVRSSVIPPGVNLPSSAVPPPLPTANNISRTPGVCNQYVYSKSTRGRLLWVTKFLADNGFYVILDDHVVSNVFFFFFVCVGNNRVRELQESELSGDALH